MKESGYYPPGAEFDPNAPYNQKDPEERTYKKHVVVQLEKDVDITVWEGYDEDWQDAFNQCCHTITRMLELLKSYVEKEMNKPPEGKERKSKRSYQDLISDSEGWEQTYFEVL